MTFNPPKLKYKHTEVQAIRKNSIVLHSCTLNCNKNEIRKYLIIATPVMDRGRTIRG